MEFRPGYYFPLEVKIHEHTIRILQLENHIKSATQVLTWISGQKAWIKTNEFKKRITNLLESMEDHALGAKKKMIEETKEVVDELVQTINAKKGTYWKEMLENEIRDGFLHLTQRVEIAEKAEDRIESKLDHFEWLGQRCYAKDSEEHERLLAIIKNIKEICQSTNTESLLMQVKELHSLLNKLIIQYLKLPKIMGSRKPLNIEKPIRTKDLAIDEYVRGQNVTNDEDKEWPLFSFVISDRLHAEPINDGQHIYYLKNRICFDQTRGIGLSTEPARFSIPKGLFQEEEILREHQSIEYKKKFKNPENSMSINQHTEY